MTIEELSQYLSAYIDQKVEEVKLQLFYNPNSRVAVGLSEFEDKEMKQYSGFEYLKHETMRMLVRNLAKLGVDGFGKEKIETLTALDSTDSPGGYSLVLEDPHPVLGVAEAALLILPVNNSDKERLQIAFFIEGGQLRISSRNGSYLSWGDWAKSNDVGKSIVAGDYDNLRERFIGQGLGQDQVANRRLDNLICRRYRNLEGDVFLPVQDYVGRTRPIETRTLLKEFSTEGGVIEYVLENTPFIGDMVENPNDWMIYNVTANGHPQDRSVKVLTCEYLGDYEGSTNCCRITTNLEINSPVVGNTIGIISFKAKGVELNYNPAFPRNINGHGRVYSCGGSWFDKKSGDYIAIAAVEYAANPLGQRQCLKIHRTNDRMAGAWTQDNIVAEDDFIDLIPAPYKGFGQIVGNGILPGSSNIRYWTVPLYDETTSSVAPYGTCKAIGILLLSEDLSYRKLIIPTIDYVYENALSVHGYGTSITYYKGKYIMSIMDGSGVPVWDGAIGKRQMLVADNIEGPYTYKATIVDYTDDHSTVDGMPFTESTANGQLIVFNGELFYWISGAPNELTSGCYRRLEFYLLKYSDFDNSWNFCVKGPILTGLFGVSSNYPGLNLTWGRGHLGTINFHYIEGNKFWIGFAATDTGYQCSIGYIDLDKALS